MGTSASRDSLRVFLRTSSAKWAALLGVLVGSSMLHAATLLISPTPVGGRVTSPVGPLNCGGNPSAGAACSSNVSPGVSVTLTAAPDTGYAFVNWSGQLGTITANPLSAAMPVQGATLTANFLPVYALSVSAAGTGSGTVTSSPSGINCIGACSANFTSGTSVTLSAAPTAGSVFTGWGGACSGLTCTITMNAATSVIANFVPLLDLTASTVGNGGGSVASSPAGIACADTCTASFASGSNVTLTASPNSGSTFSGWSGACTGISNPCIVAMTAAKSVVASFFDPKNLSTPRAGHTATLLHNGKILIAGGSYDPNGPLALTTYLASAELYDPSTGTTISTGSMASERAGHSASMLASGKVLVVGGANGTTGAANLSSAEIYDPATGTWSAAASMATARSFHTATILGPGGRVAPLGLSGLVFSGSGKVLVAGGVVRTSQVSKTYLTSAEVYDPATNTWSSAGNMATARSDHTASSVALDGTVVVIGGVNGSGAVAGTERFDPSNVGWTSLAPLAAARSHHSATVINAATLLVAGGTGTAGALASAALLNLATGTWTATGSLANARAIHAAALLPSGKVVITGGLGPGGDGVALASETFDPATDVWSTAATSAFPRYGHTASLLPWGRLVIAGGNGGGHTLASVEQHSFTTNQWASPGSVALTWAGYNHTATLNANGKVFIPGYQPYSGCSGCDPNASRIYDPATNTVQAVPSNISTDRTHPSSTLLPDGKILVVGGSLNGSLTGVAEIYDPLANTAGGWSIINPNGENRNTGHTATALADGRILVAGGFGSVAGPTNALVYSPFTHAWTSVGSMPSLRRLHTATLLGTNTVLLAGGNNGTTSLASTEIFRQDMTALTRLDTAGMSMAREGHTATLLSNGKVLVAGGIGTASAEIYDAATDSWHAAASMSAIRSGHTATLLPDGRVLVAGGFNGSYLLSAEIYDPWSDTWSSTALLNSARAYHAATLLLDGSVLLTGGSNGTSAVSNSERFRLFPEVTAGTRPAVVIAQVPSTGFSVHTGDIPSTTVAPERLFWLEFSSDDTEGTQRSFSPLEASGGTTSASAVNYPVAQIRHLDSGTTAWVPLDASVGFSEYGMRVSANTLPAGFPSGPALATLFARGVASVSKPVVLIADRSISFSTHGNGAASGSVSADPNLLACGNGCVTAPYGARALFTAVAGPGSAFLGWGGGACDPVASVGTQCITYALETDTTAVAEFVALTIPLTVSFGGNGIVSGGGINCGTTSSVCSAGAPYGTTVSLTAFASTGWQFIRWEGDCGVGTGGNICFVNVGLINVVNAVFQRVTTTLISGPSTSTLGSPVTLSATVSGASFQTGSVAFMSDSVVIPGCEALPLAIGTGLASCITSGLSAGVHSITAAYTDVANGENASSVTTTALTHTVNLAITYALDVTRTGSGSGTVTSAPAGINCAATCIASFNAATVVTLNATPESGSTFAGWSGACTGTAPCVVTMSVARSVTATFSLIPYTVTPSSGANGSIAPNFPQSVVPGSTTTFTVTPLAGYRASVVGTCGGSFNVATGIYTTAAIVANCTVIASFTQTKAGALDAILFLLLD